MRGGSKSSKAKGAPPKKRGREGKAAGGRGAAPEFYELNDEEDAATAAVGLGSARDKQAQTQRRRYVDRYVLFFDGRSRDTRVFLSFFAVVSEEERMGGGEVKSPTVSKGKGVVRAM